MKMADKQEIKLLPISKQLKNPRWSYIYAYNIRTIRDIFVYCNLKEQINEKNLYEDIKLSISPPKNKWINVNTKRQDRLILEYVHAAKYLGLIKNENNFILLNFDEFEDEKRIIIEENKGRTFGPSQVSPPFTKKESDALLNIVLNYERSRDFLRWFLDFSKFPDIWSFDIINFKNEAEPILILGKIEKNKKGSSVLRRKIDNQMWKIPDEKPDDYTRIASNLFPKWFKELGLIDKITIFPEFSDDDKLWHMYYPLKMNKTDFMDKNIREILHDMFLSETSQKTVSIFIPHLLYLIAIKYYCPINAIKKSIENIYREDFSHYYLEKTSVQTMKSRKTYEDNYIKVDGSYRSFLKIIRE